MTTPKTFFLNERQELSSFDRKGFGPLPKYKEVNWSARVTTLTKSFLRATAPPVEQTRDPLATRHHFLIAVPMEDVEKVGKDGRIVRESPTFGGKDSKRFRKIGMDLIETIPEGRATVHVANAGSLLTTMEALNSATKREQAHWITFAEFQSLDRKLRVDETWLAGLESNVPVETWIRFQPILSRVEVQELLQAISSVIAGTNTRLSKAGREFSGRYWCVGLLTRAQIEAVATEFSSVQSIHPRYSTPFAMAPRRGRAKTGSTGNTMPTHPPVQVAELPTVAIVDTGIPEHHVTLAPYRRAGYRDPGLDSSMKFMGDHGSYVASCAVFGNIPSNHGAWTLPPPRCRVMDVMVSFDETNLDDEAVIPAIEAIVGTAPDVRVFNLSFGGPPLNRLGGVRKREALIKLQDMENLAFARDVLLVLAAGNTRRGVVPTTPYPNHLEDPNWALGVHARSFNGIVCGGYVDTLGVNVVAGIVGAPSPFTRIGPGLCGSPVPGFGAPGGDCLDTYGWAPGTGVGVISPRGHWEDLSGTSLAAPLVAAEAALTCQEIARHCGEQTIPFIGTVKAWLNLVATRPSLPGAHEQLAKRTLGRGRPSAERLLTPNADTAVFVWQSVLQAAGTVSRVRVPIPAEWLKNAKSPKLRVVVAWNSPVNMALENSWACRKVSIKLRPFGGKDALRGKGASSGGYPLIDRTYEVQPEILEKKGYKLDEESWILEAEYEEIGDYPPAMTVSPQQKIGAVIELFDDGETNVSPQSYVQALAVATELDRLSAQRTPILNPITIRP